MFNGETLEVVVHNTDMRTGRTHLGVIAATGSTAAQVRVLAYR
jgi:hypothetical protein